MEQKKETKKQVQLGDPNHDHTGQYEGIGQAVFMGQNGSKVLVVNSLVCKGCGIIFTNVGEMPGPGANGAVATPPTQAGGGVARA